MGNAVDAVRADPRFAGSEWIIKRGPLVAQNRNAAIAHGGLGGFDYVLCWDTDIVATPDQLMQLVERKVAIVGAAYRSRVDKNAWTAGIKGGLLENEIHPECRKVIWVGAGFLLIETEVLQGWKYPFAPGKSEAGVPVGEDVQFCLDAAGAGYSIYCDCGCVVKHLIEEKPDMPKEDGGKKVVHPVEGVVQQVMQQPRITPRVWLDNLGGPLSRVKTDIDCMVLDLVASVENVMQENTKLKARVKELEELRGEAKDA